MRHGAAIRMQRPLQDQWLSPRNLLRVLGTASTLAALVAMAGLISLALIYTSWPARPATEAKLWRRSLPMQLSAEQVETLPWYKQPPSQEIELILNATTVLPTGEVCSRMPCSCVSAHGRAALCVLCSQPAAAVQRSVLPSLRLCAWRGARRACVQPGVCSGGTHNTP